MIPLEDLISAIQSAVVEATDQVRLKNISVLRDYFVEQKQDPQDPAPAPLIPRMLEMAFPRVTESGPGVHVVKVPLISLAPPSNLYLSELRVKMHVEFDIAEGGDRTLRVRPVVPLAPTRDPLPTTAAEDATRPATETAEIEIVIRHGDDPRGLQDVVHGYDRALRAEIPG